MWVIAAGETRKLLINVPQRYWDIQGDCKGESRCKDCAKESDDCKVPLYLVFHGWGQSAEQAYQEFNFNEYQEEKGFLGNHGVFGWHTGFFW